MVTNSLQSFKASLSFVFGHFLPYFVSDADITIFCIQIAQDIVYIYVWF